MSDWEKGHVVTLGVVGKPKRRCWQRTGCVTLVGDRYLLVKCPQNAREMAFHKGTLRYVKECKRCMGCDDLVVTASEQCPKCRGTLILVSRIPTAYYIVT